MKEKILVAMSGGVDSSVCAHLLQKDYLCHGVMMQLFTKEVLDADTEDSVRDARLVADRLAIPFTLLDLSRDFSETVIDYFIRTYEEGGTPNPCVHCNKTMKFGRLLEAARALGCEKIATGHYARIEKGANGRMQLLRAKDLSKDQSYVLWQLSQEQLSRILLPLGEFTKDEVRRIASDNGFCNASRSDSQDICFIPDGDYVAFIERYTKKSFPQGNFIDRDGNVLGRHNGCIRYTVGQRKGLGIAFGKPTYVCSKDARANTVTLGSNEDLFTHTLTAHAVNLISLEEIPSPMRVEAKIRYSAAPAPATVEQTSPTTFTLRFDTPQRAVTPGQSVVLYVGDVVIGGGIID